MYIIFHITFRNLIAYPLVIYIIRWILQCGLVHRPVHKFLVGRFGVVQASEGILLSLFDGPPDLYDLEGSDTDNHICVADLIEIDCLLWW